MGPLWTIGTGKDWNNHERSRGSWGACLVSALGLGRWVGRGLLGACTLRPLCRHGVLCPSY